jgi:hypothetical protein
MYFNTEIGILDWYTVECEVHWLVFVIQWTEKMHSETLKFVNAQQAKPYNIYKNTKFKLLKTNAETIQ